MVINPQNLSKTIIPYATILCIIIITTLTLVITATTPVIGLPALTTHIPLLSPINDQVAVYPPYPNANNSIAICLAIKDQQADIVEFIRWHQYIGIDKIYVFDQGSIPPLYTVIYPYIESNYVEYFNYEDVSIPSHYASDTLREQQYVYNTCLQLFSTRHQWIALIDTDEYLYPFITADTGRQLVDIHQILQLYRSYAGVALNWKMCGSNGHIERPINGTYSIIKSYTQCLPDTNLDNNGHVKIVANTQYTIQIGDTVHETVVVPGQYNVDTNYQPVYTHHTAVYNNHALLLYHYVTQSYEDYQQKMQRGSGARNKKPIEFFHTINELATEVDTSMAQAAIQAENNYTLIHIDY